LFRPSVGGESVGVSLPRGIFPAVAVAVAAAAAAKKRGLVDVRATNKRKAGDGVELPLCDKRLRSSPRLNNNNNNNNKDKNKDNNKNNNNINNQITTTKKTHRKLEDHYDLRDQIGSGTCGQVRRAIHRRTGRTVAVKIISISRRTPRHPRSPTPTTSIESEATILQSLHHPYIVPLLDFFLHPNTAVYLVMELLAGGDLFDRIVERGRYSEREARRVMRRMLSAVHYLHQTRGIVHRDLKPENILCASRTDDVTVKLTDFGLAKSLGEGDGCKTFCGTPQYFAPEVLSRRYTLTGRGRYGKEADMWSLGVVLYVLLSGTPPFDVSESMDVVAGTRVTFWDKGWEDVSDGAKGFVSGLLETDPKKRTGVVGACEHTWILTEDGDTHRHPLDDPVLVGMGGGEEDGGMKKRTALEGVSGGDRIGSGSDGGIIDVRNNGRSSQREIATTASSSSPAAPQSIAASNEDDGIRSTIPAPSTTPSSKRAKHPQPDVVTANNNKHTKPPCLPPIPNTTANNKPPNTTDPTPLPSPSAAAIGSTKPSSDERRKTRHSLFSHVKQLSSEGGQIEAVASGGADCAAGVVSSSTTAVAALHHNLDRIIDDGDNGRKGVIADNDDDDGKPLASGNELPGRPLDVKKLSSTCATSRPIILVSNAGSCTSAGSGSGRENGGCGDNSNGSSVVNGRVDRVSEGVTVKVGIGVEERKMEEDGTNEKGQENVAVAAANRGIKGRQMTLRGWFEKMK